LDVRGSLRYQKAVRLQKSRFVSFENKLHKFESKKLFPSLLTSPPTLSVAHYSELRRTTLCCISRNYLQQHSFRQFFRHLQQCLTIIFWKLHRYQHIFQPPYAEQCRHFNTPFVQHLNCEEENHTRLFDAQLEKINALKLSIPAQIAVIVVIRRHS
jgi:hypothetical protein